jgi:hypothetical protein
MAGQTDCTTGCYSLMSDAMHCGSCTTACQTGIACIGGACNCPSPSVACGGTCAVLASDPAHCGGCTNNCGPGGTCTGGVCGCTTGYTLCNGSCVNLMTDRNNCMTCGNACGPTQGCVAGACVNNPPYHGWTSPIPGCDTSSWNAMLPTVLGGYYPYNLGDSPACRAWKLAATVCTTQPTMYVDDTNWMCPMSGGFTDPVFGTYCAAPSTQYACSTCPGLCNAGTCGFMPLSLRNCSGFETSQM